MNNLYSFFFGVGDFLNSFRTYRINYLNSSPHCQKLQKAITDSQMDTFKQFAIILSIDTIIRMLHYFIPFGILNITGFPFKIIQYTLIILNQQVHISRITTLATKVQVDVYNNQDLLIYELEPYMLQKTGLKNQVDLVIKALLFSIILLVQTSVLDIVFAFLPSQLIIIDQLLYGVYISVGLISLKVPYQDHLPFYFHNHIWYLAGFSAPLALILLNTTGFPYLGMAVAAAAPVMLTQVINTEIPIQYGMTFNEFIHAFTNIIGGTDTLKRDSYSQHLTRMQEDNAYQRKAKWAIGWFGFPKMIRPFFLKYVNTIVKSVVKLVNIVIAIGNWL